MLPSAALSPDVTDVGKRKKKNNSPGAVQTIIRETSACHTGELCPANDLVRASFFLVSLTINYHEKKEERGVS